MPTDEAVEAYKSKELRKRESKKPDFGQFVVYPTYMDDLARDIGCMPDTAFSVGGAALWYSLQMAPNVPSVYRLRGPDAWDGAEAYVRSIETVKPWHYLSFPPGGGTAIKKRAKL